MERPSFFRSCCILTSLGPRGLGGSAPLTTVPSSVKASSPSVDQDVRLAPFTTVSNDKVPVAAHGPGLPRGVHVVCKGSGGLLALVLRLPPGFGLPRIPLS